VTNYASNIHSSPSLVRWCWCSWESRYYR